jgi:hypothetical protein
VRSTPARALRPDQLLVDRHSVNKINSVAYPLPQNTVTVELTNQLTGEQSTRNLRWDQQITLDGPLHFSVGDSGKITVELAQLSDDQDRPLYKYRIEDEAAGIDQEGTDLHLGPRLRPDNIKAAKTLLSTLYAAGEAYETELEGGIDSENLDLFDMKTNEWAYLNMEHIEVAQVELGRGMEAGR